MKRALHTLVLFGTLLSSVDSVFCRINFSSRDAALKVGNKGRLNVSSSNFEVDGTLVTKQGASVEGNDFLFSDGILENNGTEVIMTATYVPTGNDSLELRGNGRFKVEPGTVIHQLTVFGADNRLEGQPLFANPINLNDSTTTLTIAIQNKLNNDINLTGGILKLDDDLDLADDTQLNGPGTIKLNRRTLGLGGFYSKPWSSSLHFDSATDMNLTGSVALSGRWTFLGTNNLQGNGAVLDLSQGGQLVVPNDSLLYINDLYIRGLGNGSLGQIVLGGPTASIRTSNVFFEFDTTYNFTTGGIYVDGVTTFVLKENDLIFDQQAKLTVDRTTLWLDVPNQDCGALGALRPPLPVFISHIWNNSNVLANISGGTLELLGTGTIKEIADKSLVAVLGSDSCLFSGPITTTVTLNNSIFVACNQVIRIDANICLDGCGQTIYFANTKKPQFIISENVTLCLRNINFSRINDTTFDFRTGARVNIEHSVAWEFSENVTFSTNFIKLVDETGFNIFTLRGLSGRKKISFRSINPALATLLDLQDNTLLLQSVELNGLGAITHLDSEIAGAIALSGEAAVDIDVDTDMNFVVETVDNDMVLLKDSLRISGSILFGDCPCNALHIKSAFTDPVVERPGVTSGNPLVVLSGNPGLFVTSELGVAGVFFDDLSISVRNIHGNAFIVDDQSLINCKRLEILDNPIKQSSTEFRLEAIELFGQKIDPSFIRSPLNRAFYGKVPVTALHLAREREREMFQENEQAILDQLTAENLRPLGKKKQNGRRKKRELDELLEQTLKSEASNVDDQALKLPDDHETADHVDIRKPAGKQQKQTPRNTVVACPNIPASFDQTYENATFDASSSVVGNVRLRNGGITNFTLGTAPTNITLEGNSFVNQGTQNVTFGPSHFMNIRGKDNRLKVTHNMVLSEGFCFEKNSELTIEFENSGDQAIIPTIHLPKDASLGLPEGCELRFEGAGEVIFADGAGFTFGGTVQAEIIPVGKPDCSILKGDDGVIPTRVFQDQTILQRPRLIFDNGALLTLEHGATAQIGGIGFIGFFNASKLVLNKPSLLAIGNDVKQDDIKFCVNGCSEVRIDDESGVIGGGPARLGFHGGTEALVFEDCGRLFIGRKGVLEINAQGPAVLGPNPQSTLKRGNLQILSFGNGGSFFNDGMFRLGLNAVDPDLLNPTTSIVGTGHTFTWRAVNGQIAGSGLVEFVGRPASQTGGTYRGFTGRFNIRTVEDVFSYDKQLTSEELCELFVQQSPTLKDSTLFLNASGTTKILRTVLGISVPLKDGDVILGESGQVPSVIVSGRDASGKSFVIKPDGTRS
ncbi:hypothetical protein JST56_01660 [Candidatus Dependentiae bacterium]|nr:hypothetical protein [Candidatus Dependentiae bacterium]